MSAVFSQDGQRVLTASYDQTARLWDVHAGDEILAFRGHNDAVMSAVFSQDGQRVLTASFDQTARLWDARTGDEILAFKGHDDWVRSAVFSPDGQRVLTASDDQTARLWDARTGDEILAFKGHNLVVVSAVFSRDGQRVRTETLSGKTQVWSVKTGAKVRAGRGGFVEAAVRPADGRLIRVHDGLCTILDGDGRLLLRRVQFPDSWATLDEDDNVLTCGPNAWKYLHGVRIGPDGAREVVNPWVAPEAAA
jgi:WD40 repeat protein